MKAVYQFPDRPWMTADEVAEAYRITRSHVYHLVKTGALPSIRLGRVWRFATADMKRLAGIETEKPDTVGAEPGLT